MGDASAKLHPALAVADAMPRLWRAPASLRHAEAAAWRIERDYADPTERSVVRLITRVGWSSRHWSDLADALVDAADLLRSGMFDLEQALEAAPSEATNSRSPQSDAA